jgi:hypothetical protein
MAYLLKMIRVILITFEDICIKLFNSEWKLLLVSALWSSLIVSIDIYMKKYLHNSDYNLKLYPQFHQFLCDADL